MLFILKLQSLLYRGMCYIVKLGKLLPPRAPSGYGYLRLRSRNDEISLMGITVWEQDGEDIYQYLMTIVRVFNFPLNSDFFFLNQHYAYQNHPFNLFF